MRNGCATAAPGGALLQGLGGLSGKSTRPRYKALRRHADGHFKREPAQRGGDMKTCGAEDELQVGPEEGIRFETADGIVGGGSARWHWK